MLTLKRHLENLCLDISWIVILLCILQVFPVFGQSREDNGKFIGDLRKYAHSIAGKVYAVDESRILIKNFTYDGLGPDTFFWVGISGNPSTMGIIVPYNSNYMFPVKLRDFNNEDVILHLPSGYKLKDIAWFAIWCRKFTANFGDVRIPTDLSPPKKEILPEFSRLAHGLRSGRITIEDSRTFSIPNLHYDGAGPAAYFWVGTGSAPNAGGRKIPNEKGDSHPLKGYKGENITIKLPENMTIHDIDWLCIWCVDYNQDFGHVLIPKNIDVPPSLSKPASLSNCKEFLSKKVRLRWEKEGSFAKFELSGKITEKQWVALGFSPVFGEAKMVDADAIVVYYFPNGTMPFHADDYFMTAKSQCDGTNGACPDERIGGKNDVEVLHGYRKDGFTNVVFRRPIQFSEQFDKSLEKEVNIFVAIGNLNSRNEVNYHFNERTTEDIRIQIASHNDDSCSSVSRDSLNGKESKVKPWPPAIISGVQEFKVRIGPTGGKRGYIAITGNPSWGISWYVNDLLIPEIRVLKGKTYNFSVEGGENATIPAQYHPFYITDSNEGGFGQKSKEQQKKEKVYAGVGYDASGNPFPTATGRYCEWEHKTVDMSASSKSFKDYFGTLQLKCEEGQPGYLSWTVPLDIPDTVYYQCYTHNNLGWKITSGSQNHVINAFLLTMGLILCGSLLLRKF